MKTDYLDLHTLSILSGYNNLEKNKKCKATSQPFEEVHIFQELLSILLPMGEYTHTKDSSIETIIYSKQNVQIQLRLLEPSDFIYAEEELIKKYITLNKMRHLLSETISYTLSEAEKPSSNLKCIRGIVFRELHDDNNLFSILFFSDIDENFQLFGEMQCLNRDSDYWSKVFEEIIFSIGYKI